MYTRADSGGAGHGSRLIVSVPLSHSLSREGAIPPPPPSHSYYSCIVAMRNRVAGLQGCKAELGRVEQGRAGRRRVEQGPAGRGHRFSSQSARGAAVRSASRSPLTPPPSSLEGRQKAAPLPPCWGAESPPLPFLTRHVTDPPPAARATATASEGVGRGRARRPPSPHSSRGPRLETGAPPGPRHGRMKS